MSNSAIRPTPSATDHRDRRAVPGPRGGTARVLRVMDVTPEMAKDWLAAGAANRTLSGDRVAHLLRLIKSGQFMFTGEPLMFSGSLTAGTAHLMNGQHRLNAIIMSGETVSIVVVDQVPPEAMLFMDTGKRRSFADNLTIMGYKNATMVAAVTRLAYVMSTPSRRKDLTTGGGQESPSHGELLDFFQAHEATIVASIPFGRQVRSIFAASNAAMSVVWMMLTELDAEAADDFFRRLLEGGPTGKLTSPEAASKQPMWALRRWLTNNLVHSPGRGTTRPRATMQMAVVIKGWNAEQRGDLVTNLVWKMAVEDFPEPMLLQ